jgi:hypothetical protein
MRYLRFAPLLALAACVTAPTQPGVLALPGTGKTFEQFQGDEAVCVRNANARVSAMQESAYDYYELQRRFDIAYLQCMYAKGHKVPVTGGYTNAPVGNPPPPGPQPQPQAPPPPGAQPPTVIPPPSQPPG